MSPVACTILVVAKAPVPGFAKTRLAAKIGDVAAADLAAAALLDTLDAVTAANVTARVVAVTGDLNRAARSEELHELLSGYTVVEQRGGTFGERLAAAHHDSGAVFPGPLVQIGMDTPQVTGPLLTAAAKALTDDGVDAVYGPACDGGWWALGLTHPTLARFLSTVTMSEPDTGARTLDALRAVCPVVVELPTLADFDTSRDVWTVAADLDPNCRFRRTAEALGATSW